MGLADYLDVGKEAAEDALYPFARTGQAVYNAAPGQDWGGLADIVGDVGMGAMEIANAPFQVAGEAVRGASEGEPLKMATAADPSGFRWPSIIQTLAPSTRSQHPPADPFVKSYQGLEGLMNLPRGVKAASDVITGEPDLAAQLGGMGLALGVLPPTARNAELPAELMNERGGLTLGPESSLPQLPAGGPKWRSRLEETIESKMPSRAPVQDVKNIISQGIPKEEVDWRGLNEFLEQQHGPVTKEQVMGHLKENPVEIGETKLAGKPSDYRRPETHRPRTLSDESDLEFEDYPSDVQEKATELQTEAADRAMEEFYWEPGAGYGVEPIDMTQENLERGTGQKDLWGKEIEPLPEKHMIIYDRKPVQHSDLSNYYQEKSVPDEEGNAIFANENDAYDAYREDVIQVDEDSARDEAYRDWQRENPIENYLEDAKAEVGYVHEPEGMEYANADEARNAFNQGTHDIYDESDDLVQSLADITENQDYRMLPVEGEPIPRLPAGQAPPGMPPPPGAGPTKFENYSTPGGQNYREVLMTLPGKGTRGNPLSDEEFGELNKLANLTNRGPQQEARYMELGHRNDQANQLHKPFERENFTGSHWDQPNVLAHIRLKDYTDPATGKKTLLVDEIQSDWHQQGRAKGYKNPEVDAKISANDRAIEEANAMGANIAHRYEDLRLEKYPNDHAAFLQKVAEIDPVYRESQSEWMRAMNENVVLRKQTGSLPNAPYKKNWHEVAFKRALHEAAQGGYDEMAWTTGEQQADRYNLAKQVASLTYEKQPTGNYYVTAQGNNGRNIEIGEHPAARLPDVVGKELADKIIAGHGEPNPSEALQNIRERGDPTGVTKIGDSWYIKFKDSDPFGTYVSKEDALKEAQSIKDMIRAEDRKVLSGLDLKIGGEGMKGFYDDMLPSFANKYLKKYGVKVRESTIPTGEQDSEALQAANIRQQQEGRFENLSPDDFKKVRRVHSVQITPELRKDILEKGQYRMIPALIGAGAAGAAAGAKPDEQQYAKGGIVQEEDMPFESQAQRGFMYAKHPKIAKRFEEETPKNAKLPEHVKKMSQGGVAGDWKDDLAGYMDEHFSDRPDQTQHLAPGGMAGVDNSQFEDLSQSGTSFPGNLGRATPPPMGAMPTPGTGPVFNARNGLPPPVPQAPLPATPAPDQARNSELRDYLDQRTASLNKYGPEEQMALEEQLQKERTGFLPNLANAGAGFADAIMQGVARAGPSNFQANLQNRLDKSQEGRRSALEHAQTGNLARIKQEMELSQMDPDSPMSRMAQRAYGASLKAMPGGQELTDEQIRALPASVIADVLAKKIDLAKAIAEVESSQLFKEASLGLQARGQAETGRHQRVEEATSAEKTGFERDKEAATHWAASPLKALSARRRLAAGASGGPAYTPDVISYAAKHGISNEAAQRIKEGRGVR